MLKTKNWLRIWLPCPSQEEGIIIYVKEELPPKKIFKDDDGRYLAVEIMFEGGKPLILGVYAPNGPKELFLKNLKQRLDQESYEQIIMMGDFNGVMDAELDKYPKNKGEGGNYPRFLLR